MNKYYKLIFLIIIMSITVSHNIALAGPISGNDQHIILYYIFKENNYNVNNNYPFYEYDLSTLRNIISIGINKLNLNYNINDFNYIIYTIITYGRSVSAVQTQCFIALENISLIIKIYSSSDDLIPFDARLTGEGPMIGGCFAIKTDVAPNRNLTQVTVDVLRRLGANFNTSPLLLKNIYNKIFDISLIKINSLDLVIDGFIDKKNWSTIINNSYKDDWIFSLPRAPDNLTALLAYTLYKSAYFDVSPPQQCNISLDGASIPVIVNWSLHYNRSYYVEGLGSIPSYGTIIGSAAPIGGPIIVVSGNESSLKKLSDKIRDIYGSKYIININGNNLTLYPRYLKLFNSILLNESRYWSVRMNVCVSKVNLSEYFGINIKDLKEKYYYIEFNNSLFMPMYVDTAEMILVYDSVHGVLVEARAYPLISLPGLLLPRMFWPMDNASTSIVSLDPQKGPPSLVLARAIGLQPAGKGAVEAAEHRSWWVEAAAFALLAVALMWPLAGFRGVVLAVGAVLIVAGISLALLPHVRLSVGGLQASFEGILGPEGRENSSFMFYGSESDVLGVIVQRVPQPCGAGLIVSVEPGNSTSLYVARSATVNVSVGEPGIYTIGVSLSGQGCSGEYAVEVIADAPPEPPPSLRNYTVPGVLVAFLGVLLLVLDRVGGRIVPGPRPPRRLLLLDWHLGASYLGLVAVTVFLGLVFAYVYTPGNCKIGGFCVPIFMDPALVAARATMLPLQGYMLVASFSSIIVALLFAYHMESGIDRRLLLLGASRIGLVLSKIGAYIMMVALPFAAARTGLFLLVDPAAVKGSIPSLVVSSLAAGVFVALYFGAPAFLVSLVVHRTSYTLLTAVPVTTIMSAMRIPIDARALSESIIVSIVSNNVVTGQPGHSPPLILALVLAVWLAGIAWYLSPRREV